MSKMSVECLKTKFQGIDVYTFPCMVKHLQFISYVAVRGKDSEEGAVQRLLSTRRVDDIRKFILGNNTFFNTFILNWTDDLHRPVYADGKMSIPLIAAAAQLIDGQHRLAGLDAAISEKADIGDQKILVSLCIGLKTSQAARIFVNINSEQRPVPKSLIYDLFGEYEKDPNHLINRAHDIADELNDNNDSPYYKTIKYPAAPRGVGIIDLSTVITALKKNLGEDGSFSKVNLISLNYQKQVVMNYFMALKYYYDKEGLWTDKLKNPFLKSSGFVAAIDYLTGTLLDTCAGKKSFSFDTFKKLLDLDSVPLLTHDQIKGLDGKTARKRIIEYLGQTQRKALPAQDAYEF